MQPHKNDSELSNFKTMHRLLALRHDFDLTLIEIEKIAGIKTGRIASILNSDSKASESEAKKIREFYSAKKSTSEHKREKERQLWGDTRKIALAGDVELSKITESLVDLFGSISFLSKQVGISKTTIKKILHSGINGKSSRSEINDEAVKKVCEVYTDITLKPVNHSVILLKNRRELRG